MLQVRINTSLVIRLISEQFPQWSHLKIKPVEFDGHDNRTFCFGDEMLIRLPSAKCYASKVQIEQKWLPILAPHVSLQIPKPIAVGRPSEGYPWNWSIYKWIEGKSANSLFFDDSILQKIALQLANFLNELHRIKIKNAPLPGDHNFFRGGDLLVYDTEARLAIEGLKGFIDTKRAMSIWQRALNSKWSKSPIWIHGDLSAGNILIKDSELVAVIDFGGMAVGDPACDLVIAWTLLKNESRKIFKSNLNLD